MQLSGQCICGAVTFSVDGDPVFQAYCHCESCQRAMSAPVAAVALFPKDCVQLAGETSTRTVTGQDGAALRISCVECGSRVANYPSGKASGSLIALFPALINEKDWFEPTLHIFCVDRALVVDDELPKYLDLPADVGGSGELLQT